MKPTVCTTRTSRRLAIKAIHRPARPQAVVTGVMARASRPFPAMAEPKVQVEHPGVRGEQVQHRLAEQDDDERAGEP
ncbi:hypothetical protein [Nonomuraea jabiensis]|uniref:Uncharacterized protein n=1 Tax=Nonomuraea jabiensis TaxID=882448 RepID=A0A7W9GBR1_9ACTN|nr:hypothetical protein [Nonomuraea jabiensis]MBB5780849.1 hypothetical protein [Nonomuraea jabiensis]